MAKLDDNSPLKGASGSLGKDFYLKRSKYGTILCAKPGKGSRKNAKKDNRSELQKLNNNSFGDKAKIYQAVKRCPEVLAALTRITKGEQDVYHFLMSKKADTPKVKALVAEALAKGKARQGKGIR